MEGDPTVDLLARLAPGEALRMKGSAKMKNGGGSSAKKKKGVLYVTTERLIWMEVGNKGRNPVAELALYAKDIEKHYIARSKCLLRIDLTRRRQQEVSSEHCSSADRTI